MSVGTEEEDPFFEELTQLRQELGNNDGLFRREALSLAVNYNRTEIVQAMMLVTEDVNHPCDCYGKKLVMVAAENGHCEMAAVLLNAGARVGGGDVVGETALHKAAYNGRDEVVQLLIDHGADVNEIDNAGNTPLHHCVCINPSSGGNLFETLEVLVSNDANILAENNDMQTPFHHIVESGNVDMAMWFMGLLSSPQAVTTVLLSVDLYDQLPFHFVKKHGMASFLIESSMDTTVPGNKLPPQVCRDMLLARDRNKQTLLDFSRDQLVKEQDDEDLTGLITYLETYTDQPLSVTTSRTTTTTVTVIEGTMQFPLNDAYSSYQRSIAEEFLTCALGVPSWLIPSRDENGIVIEAHLPLDIQCVILSFLTLTDIMV